MASNGGAQRDMQLSNLIWQLKLRTERQFGTKDTLRVLMSEPERLNFLLDQALASGDSALHDLAHDIQRLRDRNFQSDDNSSPLNWAIAIGIGAFLLIGFVAVFQMFSSETPSMADWPQNRVLRMHGSNTVGESLAPALIKGWMLQRGAANVESVQLDSSVEHNLVAAFPLQRERQAVELFAHGSSTAFRDMKAGLTDIGMASRRIKPQEVEDLREQFGNLRSVAGEHVVALDGLAVIVNASNPINALTRAQVSALFSGAVENWTVFDSSFDLPVAIYARDDNSGTYDTFKSMVLKPSARQLSGDAKRFESSSELVNNVAEDAGAIGFVGLSYVGKTKVLGIAESADSQPVVPTRFTVGTEDYPLSRRLYLYAGTGSVAPEIDSFIRFALSEDGQQLVEKVGLVSLNVAAERIVTPDAAPPDYRRLTSKAERLSLNFRFESGAVELDTRGQRDLDRLVAYLANKPGRAVMLFGFSDGAGEENDSVALSLERAKHVESALQSRGVFSAAVKGFGTALPLASDDTQAGRQRNRRVEVWLR